VRTPSSGDGNRDATSVGPTVGPITGGFYIIYAFLVRTRPNIFNCFLFSIFLVGPCGALFL